MPPIETVPYDPVDYLSTNADIAAYLAAAAADGDAQLMAAALSDAARAIGINHLAQISGIAREKLLATAPDAATLTAAAAAVPASSAAFAALAEV